MPKLKKNLPLAAFFGLMVVLFTACDNNGSIMDSQALKEEIGNRKIKKISESRILEVSYTKGKEVIDKLSTDMEKKSVGADTLDKQYRVGAMQPLVESLQQANKAEIKKLSPPT